MPTITVFGSINYDLVTTTERFPNAGETLAALRFETHHGGKGANQAVAARRLAPGDVKVNMVGRVGDDNFGTELVQSLEDEGINVSNVVKSPAQPTGTATILVDESSGENRILVFPGANGTFSDEDVPNDLIKQSDILVVQNEIPTETVYRSLSVAKMADVITIYNPSPMPVDKSTGLCNIPLAVLADVTYLIVNSSEADMLIELVKRENQQSGNNSSVQTVEPINDRPEIAQKALPMLELYGKCNVIITLGANGCVFKDESLNEVVHSPARAIPKGQHVVDTTGAGDTFLGAFAAFIAQHGQVRDAVRFGAMASAIAVTRRGAKESIPLFTELR